MNVCFSLKYPLPPPNRRREEGGGGCHFHGNLIYHKRISFVTWPSNGGTSSERTHTQTRTHDEGRVRSSGGDDLKERKKTNCGQRMDCLSSASTFHLWRGLTKGNLARLPSSFSRELSKWVQGQKQKHRKETKLRPLHSS